MNILVTGGYGHIGTYLVKALLDAGDNVVVLDKLSSPSRMHYPFDAKAWPTLKFVQGDIRDAELLERICRESKIEVIAHMVAMLAAESKLDPVASVEVNCNGTLNVFDVARRLSLKRVVWSSSLSVFGAQSQYGEVPLPNDAPHYPRDLYGVCKSFGERLGTIYSESYGVNIVGVRFTQGYGVGRERGGGMWTVDLTQNSVRGKPVVIPNGDDSHNWVLAEDEADVIFSAVKADKVKSGNYSMSGEVASKKEVTAIVKELVPEAKISLQPGKFDHARLFDDSMLQRELGWKPKHSLREGLKKTVEYARKTPE